MEFGGVLTWMPDWALPLALAAFAATGGAVLHAIAYVRLRELIPAQRRALSVIANRLRLPTQIASMTVVPLALLPLLPLGEADRPLAGAVGAVLLVAVVGWCGSVAAGVLYEVSSRRYVRADDGAEVAASHRAALRATYLASILTGILATAATASWEFQISPWAAPLLALATLAIVAATLWRGRHVISNFAAAAAIERRGLLQRNDCVNLGGDVGWIEDVAPTYSIVRLWNWRRTIISHRDFLRHAIAEGGQAGAEFVETAVDWHLDGSVPVDRVREKLAQLTAANPSWDGRTATLEVTDAGPEGLRLRAVLTARTPETAWDLRADIREDLLAWLRQDMPDALPHGGDGEEPAAGRLPSARRQLAPMASQPAKPIPRVAVPAR